MTHSTWPLFDLRIRTPRLEIRYVDDEVASALARLAAKGIHDPDYMPFTIPWSTAESPMLERNAMQFYWRCRADLSPDRWHLTLAVLEDGAVVGTTGLMAEHFPVTRTFETGSWLGREHQGKGLGKEMRIASLHLGFLGFDARWATTRAWDDNGPSNGVTRSLGYAFQGVSHDQRVGSPATTNRYNMSRDHFESRIQRNDVTFDGLDAAREQLGLDPPPPETLSR